MAAPPTFTFATSYTSEVDHAPRVKIAKFGDGYEQRSPDGINNNPRVYNYVGDFSRSYVSQIEAFLNATAGWQSFYWTPPYQPTGLFVADQGWQITENGFDYAVIKSIFREVFEL